MAAELARVIRSVCPLPRLFSCPHKPSCWCYPPAMARLRQAAQVAPAAKPQIAGAFSHPKATPAVLCAKGALELGPLPPSAAGSRALGSGLKARSLASCLAARRFPACCKKARPTCLRKEGSPPPETLKNMKPGNASAC